MIDTLFDHKGFVHYKVTFPDGNEAWTSCCWFAEILLKRWESQTYAVNYRGENLNISS